MFAKNQISGLVLAVVGIVLAAYAYLYLPIGELRRMGPGMFPAMIGVALAVVGSLVAITADDGPRGESVDVRSLFFVLLAVGVFALVAPAFGVIPAVIVMVTCSSLASSQWRIVTIITLSLTLPLLAYLIFSVMLGLPLRMVIW